MLPALESLAPRGPWLTPLTDDMIHSALRFGIEAARAPGFPIDDVFRIPTDERLQAVVTFSSAFERLAKYAWVRTTEEVAIDEQFVQATANDDFLRTHYVLDIVSPHPAISVMRYVPIIDSAGSTKRDGYEGMLPVHRAELSKGAYRQVVAFPYAHAYAYGLQDAPEIDYFEAAVPWLPWFPIFGKLMVSFEARTYLYH